MASIPGWSGGRRLQVRHPCFDRIASGHFDEFVRDGVVAGVAGPETISLDRVKEFAGREHLNMTLLALNLSGYVNGVAKGHRETTERLFPGYSIRAVTNGVHPLTWTHSAFQRLYDKHFPGWASEPELLVRATTLPDQEVMAAHREAKHDLTQLVNARSRTQGQPLSPDTFTIGFARRATRYKRHTLFFSDPERLMRIVRKYPVQVIFACKAYPRGTNREKG